MKMVSAVFELLYSERPADGMVKITDVLFELFTAVQEIWYMCTLLAVTCLSDGFGGLVVSMLASGSRVCGFKPGRSRWIFLYVKILSMPSFRGEVK
jgi:hypothetical protein